jgi:hypothetical protein
MRVHKVLVLSPFPCVDSATMFYRRSGASVRALAEKYGFEYLDVIALDPKKRDTILTPEGFYADPYHLGIAGHRAVAGAIVRALACQAPVSEVTRSGRA